MNINDLPDDCLLSIFSQISRLDELFTIGLVCPRWRKMLCPRFNQIKELDIGPKLEANCRPGHLVSRDNQFLRAIDASEIFPNLKTLRILPFFNTRRCNCKSLFNFLTSSKTLTGLVISSIGFDMQFHSCDIDLREIVENCGNLEFIDIKDNKFLNIYFNEFHFGRKLKELSVYHKIPIQYFNNYSFKLENLEKVSISSFHGIMYIGPILEKLQSLYFHIESAIEIGILSKTPNLRVFHLKLDLIKDDDLKFSIIHNNVRELYLYIMDEFSSFIQSKGVKNIVETFLSLFPNCEYLKISTCHYLTSSELIEIGEIHPKLDSITFFFTKDIDDTDYKAIDEFNKLSTRRFSLSAYSCKNAFMEWNMPLY